ncbi:hypothetical protein BSKO_00352 [Bryopsis sp. KO-2023]|nr:hypothetical protein BSKO_00352 [Bryopsis sp. KO-2023]
MCPVPERKLAKPGSFRSMTAAMSGKFFDTAQSLRELASMWLPPHTRTAVDALVEDVKGDVPKDLAFLKHHASALKPRTFRGWLFVASFFTALVAAELAVLCTAAFVVCGLMIATFFAFGVLALTLNVVLIPSGLVLLGLAWCAGMFSLMVGAGGCSLVVTHMFIKRAHALFVGDPVKKEVFKSKSEDSHSHISSNDST